MSTPTVNISALTRMARQYNNVLKELPYFSFAEMAKNTRINILEVDGEDVLINKRRKAGLIRPYKPGLSLGDEAELMKFYEAKLKPEVIYAEINDNILGYKDKKVISNAGEPVNHKSKKHPLEFLILRDIVRSVAEDVVFNIFHAQRDVDTASPETSFNGFFHKINLLTTAGEISAGNGNLKTTGAFAPAAENEETSTANYDRMVTFLKSAHPLLRRSGEVLLYVGDNPLDAVRRDFRKLVKAFDYPSMEQVVEKLRADADIPGLKIINDLSYGTGDQLILTKPGMLDFGVGSSTDQNFVQVRDINKDPNVVQFWVQAAYDTRINDVHQKLFMINEQKNAALNLAGDY